MCYNESMRKINSQEKSISLLLVIALALTGCSGLEGLPSQTLPGAEETDEFTSLGLSPEFDYEVPESLPSILVDQVGYACRSNKLAMISGEEPPDDLLFLTQRAGAKSIQERLKKRAMTRRLAHISVMPILRILRHRGPIISRPLRLVVPTPLRLQRNLMKNCFKRCFNNITAIAAG